MTFWHFFLKKVAVSHHISLKNHSVSLEQLTKCIHMCFSKLYIRIQTLFQSCIQFIFLWLIQLMNPRRLKKWEYEKMTIYPFSLKKSQYLIRVINYIRMYVFLKIYIYEFKPCFNIVFNSYFMDQFNPCIQCVC